MSNENVTSTEVLLNSTNITSLQSSSVSPGINNTDSFSSNYSIETTSSIILPVTKLNGSIGDDLSTNTFASTISFSNTTTSLTDVNTSLTSDVLLNNTTESTKAIDGVFSGADTFFLLTMGIIVFFMQGGFALLECGAVRSKNTTNILIKNLLHIFVAGIAYWILGYALAYGDGNSFIGFSLFASYKVEGTMLANWFFQFVFAATASTIVSGSVAERCSFSVYIVYSFLITGFIYPVVSHWAWSDRGWLAVGDGTNKFKDLAGSGVVHLVGGTSAFVGTVLLGPRIGKFDPITGIPNDIRGHSVPLTAVGGFILLFGFLAFNGGSLGHITQPGDGAALATIVANTIIGGSFGGIINLIIHRLVALSKPRQWSLLFFLNGVLAGMVSTCAGCEEFYPWGAAVVGTIGGLLFFFLHVVIIAAKIDDPLDAVAVHFGGGFWGLIAAPLFKRHSGIVFDNSNESFMGLAWNIAGMTAIIGWSGILSLLMFGLLKAFGLFRVDPETELKGLDITNHGDPAYPAPSWEEEQYSHRYAQDGNHTVDGRKSKDQTEVDLLPNMTFNENSGKRTRKTQPEPGRFRLMSTSTNPAFIPDTQTTTHL
ncbi:putative ammonium transporter 1 [Limulus polyphemus]|uniref:Ammonium transporter n=1 Tax=Limulus polyphemus TaxID=6850 RepID=A0ABM1S4C1_LIMPO|nr:putative ammonium transporter 1 [Limulus polyphemus]